MKTTSKRVISLLLAIMMVLSIFTIVPMTASAEETTAPIVTAKALYKSHKIEWSTDDTGSSEAFTISTKDNENITNKSTTDVVVDGKRYYTAILPLSTGLLGGTEYTVTKTSDSTVIGTATVADITGREALIKNAAFSVDYGTDGKVFSGTKDDKTDAVKLAKIKALNSGAIIASATRTTASNPQSIISFTDAVENGSGVWLGIRNNNTNLGGRLGSYWIMGHSDMPFNEGVKQNLAVQVQYTSTNNGTYKATSSLISSVYSLSRSAAGTQFLSSSASSFTGIYIGNKWKGTIYYVVISEEVYNDNELLALTKERVALDIKAELDGANHKLTWNASSADTYIITANGTKVENATVNYADGVCTATIPTTIKDKVDYYVTNTTGTATGSATITPDATPAGLTAKALYKSHKIEWNTIYGDATFTITRNDETINKEPTKIQIGDVYYYTVIIEDDVTKTGTGNGTEYTVTSSTDNSATTTVTEDTGLDALRKNAVLTVNYLDTETAGYKSFSGTNSAVKLDITDLQYQKIKAMTTGTWITSANYKTIPTSGAHAILSFGTASGAVETWTGLSGSSFYQRSAGTARSISTATVGNHNVVVTFNGTATLASIDGGNATTLTNGRIISDNTAITKDTFYVGGINGANAFTFTGDVYYAIFSEESYTADEIKAISQTPYGAVQAVLAEAQNYVDGYAVKCDANYRALQSEIAKYSNCSTSINIVDSKAVVKALENAISALNLRETYNGSVVAPIDKELLKKNATDNNHAKGSEVKDSNGNIISYNDGDAKQLFDNNLDSKWHSNYDTNGVGKSTGVKDDNKVWMQTGFDGETKHITKIVCTPRTDMNEDQIKTYQVYVSKNDEQPSVDAVAEGSSDWELVKEGTLEQCTSKGNSSARQVITLDKAEEAKWVRIVVSSVYNRTYGHFLAITEMDIYETVNETSIDSELLKKNAKDNNHANGSNGKDGVSAQLFDGDNTTFWHSNYANSGGTGTIGVTENTPVWMQTGFDGDTKYISKIEAYTRTGSTNNQLKKYAIYVSTSENAPDVNTSVVNSNEWTFVCGGELKAFTTPYQMHTIKFAPVEAKWVRLVAYSTSTVDNHLAMSEMKIYEVDSANVAVTDNGRKLLNKLSEVEEIMTRNDVCIDSKYNTLVSLYNKYNESDLPLISTQANIDNLVNSINAINVNNSANKTAINKDTLKANADANTYAKKDSDLPAYAAFDGNNGTWWHTNWSGSGGTGGLVVAKETPAWIQTGFGGAKTVTAIDIIPRNNYQCQIKDYAIYVSNADSKPDINTAPSAETGWTLVANGTFSFLATGGKHTVTFQPIEAKWIRVVAYSAMNSTTESTKFATIGEMNVYEATSYTHKAEVINNNLTDKLSQAKKLALRADIDADALNTAIESLGTIDLTKLTEEELQAKLETITGAVSTTPATRTLNKSDEQSFGSDSVKWNNSAERLATLANNAIANIEENNRSVKSIFDGKYEIKQLHWTAADGTGTTYYGSWKKDSTIEPWIQTGFGERVCVDGIVVFDAYNDVALTENGDSTFSLNCFKGYEVWVSNDANFNTYVVAAQGKRTGDALKYSETGYAIKFDKVYNCEYIRLVTNGSNDVKIQEIDIYEYVGQKQNLEVAIDTNACTVANDKLLNTVDFNFNKMFTDGFTKAEIEKQVLDIELSDISHNYEIVVGDDAQVSIVATDATYNLTVNDNGTTKVVDTQKYGENFNYTVDNAKGWQVDGKVIANGNTFNFMATDDVTVTAITDTVSTEVSVYIPEPVVGFDGTKTTVQIPVYVNGTTPDKKGIVLVNTDDVEAIKTAIKDGTSTANVKISKADSATLSNKGRYIHTIKANGKLTTGTFYAYVIDGDNNVTLSNAQVIG